MSMARASMWALAGLLAAGCDAAFTAGGVATVTPMFATITARDLAGLGRDEMLSVELDGAYPTVFEFDGRDGKIEFQRIEITPPGADPVSMQLWLARQAPTRGIDLTQPGARFRLANDPMAASIGIADFGDSAESDCSPVDIVELDEVVAVLFVTRSSC